MQSLSILTLLLLVPGLAQADQGGEQKPAATKAAEPKPRAPIQHLPINELESGAARMRFAIPEPDRTATIVVRYEASGVRAEAPARRTASGYVAGLPARVVQPPGFSYWVVERAGDGSEQPIFASAQQPHRVAVFHSDARRSELRRLRQRGGTRSSLIAAAEYVDFGERQLRQGDGQVPDRYYRLESGYAYAFLATVEEIELRVVRVRGEAAELRGLAPDDAALRVDPGIDYGRAAITLLIADGIRMRGSVLLGASQEGFEYGSGGALIFGNPRGLHVTLSGEALSTLGFTSGMRMGFLAAERVPMGAGVEVSNFPVGDDTGVRLIYDVGYELMPSSVLTLRAGFQGRTSVTGGPTVGMAFRYGF